MTLVFLCGEWNTREEEEEVVVETWGVNSTPVLRLSASLAPYYES